MPDDRHRRTVLHEAATDGDADAVAAALASGAPIDAVDYRGLTALALSAINSNAVAAHLLLEAGANTEIADRYGNTPLWAAVFNARGDATIVRLLREAGADPDHVNEAGRTPRILTETIAGQEMLGFL